MKGTSVTTISLDQNPVSLGDTVTFTVTDIPHGTKNPWISLTAYDPNTGDVIYGEGGKVGSSFLLGGASSQWLTQGGPAKCHAEVGDLYWKGGKEYYTFLAATEFDAV